MPNKRNYCPLRYPKCILWTGVVPLDKENVLKLQRWRLFENDHAGKLEMVTPTPKLRQVTPNRAMADHEEEPGGPFGKTKLWPASEPLLFQVIFTLVSPYKFRRRHGRVVRSLDLAPRSSPSLTALLVGIFNHVMFDLNYCFFIPEKPHKGGGWFKYYYYYYWYNKYDFWDFEKCPLLKLLGWRAHDLSWEWPKTHQPKMLCWLEI